MTETQLIHPALDFTSEHAYIGQKMQGSGFPSESNVLHIVTDSRSIIDFTDVTGERRHIRLQYTDFNLEQRWSLKGIERFVDGVEPIESLKLFARIKEVFRAYVELSDQRLYSFLTLWSIGTYFHQLFNTYPYVYVGGISQSGKTKLLTLCSSICFNSVSSADISPACLFRLIQSTRCSVLIDESEILSDRYDSSDLRSLLLSGYKKGLKVYRNRRTGEGNFVPEAFEVYSPKMLVNIEGLESVLGSRCIDIIMQRGSNGSVTAREVVINYPIWQQIRDMLYPFVMKNWKAIRQTYIEIRNDAALQNREWELWKPILALAWFFDSSSLYESMKTLATETTKETKMDDLETLEFVLVETLLQMVDEDRFYRLRTIKEEITANLGTGNRWLTEIYIGKLLRRLGFSQRRRLSLGTEYFLRSSKVRELAQRLGIKADGELSEDSEGAEGQVNEEKQT